MVWLPYLSLRMDFGTSALSSRMQLPCHAVWVICTIRARTVIAVLRSYGVAGGLRFRVMVPWIEQDSRWVAPAVSDELAIAAIVHTDVNGHLCMFLDG